VETLIFLDSNHPWQARLRNLADRAADDEPVDDVPSVDEPFADIPSDDESPGDEPDDREPLGEDRTSDGQQAAVKRPVIEEPLDEETVEIPRELPILPLRGVVFYPMTALPLTVGQPRSVRLVEDAVLYEPRIIGLVASKDADIEEPRPDQIYQVGTAVTLHRLHKTTEGIILFVHGLERIRVDEYTATTPYLKARVTPIPEKVVMSVEVEALMRNLVELFRQLVSLVPYLSDEVTLLVSSVEDPRHLANLIATSVRMDIEDAQGLLEIDDVKEKLRRLTTLLGRELEVLELGKKIQKEAQGSMEKVQREYFLREQLKAIRRELGEEDEQTVEIEDYRQQIKEAGMPEEAEKEALRELSRMEKMPVAAAEYSVIKTYLDWMVNLPWSRGTADNLDVTHARQVLDEDHYGLKDVKERILEFLAVRKLRQERKSDQEEEPSAQDLIRREREGVILCFVGPPGVGKTSLGRSIARAMNRKFIRQSLGGIRDEAEVRGFRRTYVGSMPGRIIQALRRAESKNPVFMLDEVDKIGADWRGDPSSALLEVLDPEQNNEFRDHYLDVPFDLSQVMFICTANQLGPIPAPLRDRMEIIEIDGYTEQEKVEIAKQYLVPRQIKENGLLPSEISFTSDALRRIIREYTYESGVRNLERQIGSVCRKVTTHVAEGHEGERTTIQEEDVPTYLGKRKYFMEELDERVHVPGVAVGLVVTTAGGDITFVEGTRMSGNRGLTLTGQLGDVMRESAQAALSYVRSKADDLGIEDQVFADNEIHIHVPAGAVPKDGPSAGVTMATALVSLLTERPIAERLAMTGEITLRGQVLPVGGIKQKVLAAARAGIHVVVLPRRNEADLDDLPPEVREKLDFVLVDRVDQVFEAAFKNGSQQTNQ
jgi:ATP-dependent Lon protease